VSSPSIPGYCLPISFFCLPRLLPPWTVPSMIVLASPDDLVMCPYPLSLRVPRWKCHGAPEWSVKIWLMCIFQSHIYGRIAGVATVWTPDHPDVATVSHGLKRYHPGVSRMCHCVVPVWCRFITILHGMTTVHPGVATVLLGLSRSVGTSFGFNLCFPSRLCNSNWLVSKSVWNKINIRDYLKLCHEGMFFTFTYLLFSDCLSRS